MDRFKTTLFALFAVALMALTPLAVIGEGFSAVEGSISEPESYLYTITTDLDNVQITSVEASTGGSALSQISGTRTAKEDIPDYWSFDRETGVGPFNSFYAAINIDGGYYADNGEVKRNHKVGTIAFVLDPYDLKKSINGTDLTGYYNIMLIVPTVYWKSVGTTLYLSSSPSYTAGSTTVEGMTAYAHTATSGDVSKVYPYIGIGVYEASVNGSSKMVSVRGVTPKASSTCDEFKGYADNLASAANSDYQQWNFYQWTLYKMMAYTVMGTKNSQAMIDNGQVFNSSSSPTGRGDTAGPYGANSLYSKLFLENTWGSLAEFVGDTAFFDRELYARNDLGGTRLLDDQGDANFGSQSSTGILFPSSSGRIGAAYSVSAYWDLPKAIGGDSSSFSFPGDYAWPDSGWRSLSVGGWWYTGTSAGLACADGDDSISIASNAIGARLAYVMDADAAAIGTCYISNGGTGGEVSRPQAATVEDCMFGAPWGHAFAGWNTKADGTGVWYFPGDGIDYNGHMVILYAQWEGITGRIPDPVDYMYAVSTDANNVSVEGVRASVAGSSLVDVYSGTNTTKGSIASFWDFDRSTGMGPFNSFYAAINLYDGEGPEADGGEFKFNSAAGAIAFVLDPYDLSKTLMGTEFDKSRYNVMLVIPTVYWKSEDNVLYLSSSSSYAAGPTTVEGMTAYAHTATSGDVSKVYPYIGIGVYEGYVADGKLTSRSGVVPTGGKTNDGFKACADALTPAEGSGYQQWNFYQWTLYKMMAYTVMGTKNSQEMLGDGPVRNSSSSTTGLADSAGPYSATSSYSKLLLENTWGSLYEFVGDAGINSRELYARNDLGGTRLSDGQGGANFGIQSSTGILFPSSSGQIGAAYSVSAYWDFPKAIGGDSSSFSFPGDYAFVSSGWRSLYVGGYYLNSGSTAGVATAYGYYGLTYGDSAIGTRLAYLMDADATAFFGICYTANGGTGGDVLRPQGVSVEGRLFGVPWGHVFAGWNTEADGTGVWYSPGDSMDYNGRPVVTLYAQWEMITGRIPEPTDYMYAVSTDANNVIVQGVRASVAGSSFADVYSGTNTTKRSIASFWDFDRLTGMGPFNSFYAAINLYDGDEADGAEFKLNSAAGAIAFVLDPYDLSKTLMGTEFDKSRYNVMLVIPTVYWKSEDNVLYLSSSPSYAAGPTTVEGMTAYAHTATSGGASKVYPYIGIGVYEGYVADGKLTSRSGVVPTGGMTNDGFKACADALTPAEGSGYQQWNFYQWTLYKMMAYTVMGTKSSQELLGNGPVSNSSPSNTGLADSVGPYGVTSSYSKLLLENPWGSLTEFVGDTALYDRELYVRNDLGGTRIADDQGYSNFDSQSSTGVILSPYGWISETYSESAYWDFPKANGGRSSGFSGPGDSVWSDSGWRMLFVGGHRSDTVYAGLAYAYCYYLTNNFSYMGSRLAYVMDAGAVSAPGDGLIYKVTDSAAGEASVFGTYEDLSDIVIPSTIGTYSVKSIEDHAFSGCENITCVALPGSLGYIGAGAFGECEFYDLEGNRLPVTAEALGGRYFEGESGVLRQAINVSVGTEAIVDGLRYKVVSDSPNSASLVGYEGDIEHLAVPAEVVLRGKAMPVVSVGSKAFYNCSTLNTVDLGSVVEVGQKAFANCASMTSLYVPDTVERIGAYAFYGCKKLDSLDIPGDGVVLEQSAFSACVKMRSVSFTGSGAVIERNAFYKNNGVEALDLANVASVGYKAFPYCKGLKTLTIPGTLELLDSYAFYSCANLRTLVVEEGVTAIGASAFSECRSLRSVSLPDSLESIGKNAFYGVRLYDLGGALISQKEAFSASGTFAGADGELWQTASFSDGVLKYTASNGMATVTGYEGSIGHLVVPGTVEHEGYELDVVAIGDRAFRSCSTLSIADLGGAVTVGNRAFSECSGLSIVNMPSAERLEDYAFFNCKDINAIAFSESLSYIGASALYGVKLYAADGATRLTAAEDLAGMFFMKTDGKLLPVPPEVGDELVSGGVRYVLTSSDPLAASAVGYVGSVSSLPSTVVFNGYEVPVTSVADGAFRLCTTISALDLSNVVSIGEKAFSGCSGLESATFSENLSSVGSSAFYGTLFYDGGTTVPRTAPGLAGKSFEGGGGSLYLIP